MCPRGTSRGRCVHRGQAARAELRRSELEDAVTAHPATTGLAKCADASADILSAMTEQAMVDHFAKLAKPRLVDLLKLKVRHIYEKTPGNANSKLVIDGREVDFRLLRRAQPYKNIERFLAADKLISFLVNPGVLPIVKAISMDTRGRKMLVTRKVQARDDDKGVVAHIDHFGIRVMMSFDSVLNEAQVVWESLYGVA
jgi:hypothetical protein